MRATMIYSAVGLCDFNLWNKKVRVVFSEFVTHMRGAVLLESCRNAGGGHEHSSTGGYCSGASRIFQSGTGKGFPLSRAQGSGPFSSAGHGGGGRLRWTCRGGGEEDVRLWRLLCRRHCSDRSYGARIGGAGRARADLLTNRFEEGYGLSESAIESIAQQGDC